MVFLRPKKVQPILFFLRFFRNQILTRNASQKRELVECLADKADLRRQLSHLSRRKIMDFSSSEKCKVGISTADFAIRQYKC